MTTSTKPTIDLAELRSHWLDKAIEILCNDPRASEIVDLVERAYRDGVTDACAALRTAELERDEACSKLEAVREMVRSRPGHPGPVLNSDAIVCELRRLLSEKGGE